MSGLATIAPMHNDGQRSGNSAGSQCRHGSRCYIHGEMTEAICVTAAGYADALTRGKRYMILARADDKAQIQVRTDTGLVRWFPLSCVDLSSQDVPALVRIIPPRCPCRRTDGVSWLPCPPVRRKFIIRRTDDHDHNQGNRNAFTLYAVDP